MIRKNKFLLAILSIILALMVACAPDTSSDDDDDSTPSTDTDTTSSYTRTLDERYVEMQYKGIGGAVLYSWNYNAKNELEEFCQYFYDTAGRNSVIKSYSSDTTSDTNYLGKYVYTYDGTTYNITKCELYDATNVLIQVYDATYNSNGKYLTYISKDGTGNVLESRVSTYNADGYYTEETYYSDAAQTKIMEKYTCTYDGSIPGRYVQEVRYSKNAGGTTSGDSTTDYGAYETEITYKFLWNGSTEATGHYLQQSFDASEDLLDMIQYRYNSNWKKISRSYISVGKLQSYRTYAYSEGEDYMTEETYYDSQDRITNLFKYSYAASGVNYLYEKEVYSYKYADSSSASIVNTRGISESRSLDFSKAKAPSANHHITN